MAPPDEFFPFIEKTHGVVLSKNPNEGRSVAQAAARFARGLRHGSGPIGSAASSAASAPMWGCAAATNTRRSFAKLSPSPSASSCRMAKTDLNIYGGDWWMANQEMQRALVFAGYDVKHAWGIGAHDGNQSTQVFPEAMRWLWRDYPAEIKANAEKKSRQNVNQVVDTDSPWELVGEGYKVTEGPAVNAKGEVFFNDVVASKTYKVSHSGADGMRVDRVDGRLYVATRMGIQFCDQPGRVNGSSRRPMAKSRTSPSAAKTSIRSSPARATKSLSAR
jgi:gluconolactonase